MFYMSIAIICLTGYVLFQLRLETHRNQSLVDELIKTNYKQLVRTNFHNRIFTGQRYRGINYIINRHILTLVEIERMSKSWQKEQSDEHGNKQCGYLNILEVYIHSLQAVCHTLSILSDHPDDDESKLVTKCIIDDLKILNTCSSFDQIMLAGGIDDKHEIYHRAQHFSELLHTLKGDVQD
ncbi:hypothetical protein U0129_21140 [Enterobacter hormaechei]|uniref:hypothetical protein n=2 Tax=Enterobacteriaceae TaxID=543 RepID=UPI0039C49F6C